MARRDRLFDNVDLTELNERELRVINAVDASIFRCLEKYEVVYQIIQKQKTGMISNLVYLVWELVDWLERTRKLLGLGVGFNRKTIYYINAISALKKLKLFRNELQHFDKYVSSSCGGNQALLGSVTAYAYEGKGNAGKPECLRIESYNLGLLIEDKLLGSTKLPDKMYDFVDYVTLHLGTEAVNISEIMRSILTFYQEARLELAQKYPMKEQ